MNDMQIQRLMNYYKPKRFNKMFAYTYKKCLKNIHEEIIKKGL